MSSTQVFTFTIHQIFIITVAIFSGLILNVEAASSDDTSFCLKVGEGFHPHPTDCTKFVRCVETTGQGNKDESEGVKEHLNTNIQLSYQRFDFDCAPGTVYDPSLIVCNYPNAGGTPRGCKPKRDYEIVGLSDPNKNVDDDDMLIMMMKDPSMKKIHSTTEAKFPNDTQNNNKDPTMMTMTSSCQHCHPNGISTPTSCDSEGHCNCKKYVVGFSCDTCQKGYFNLEEENHVGCLPCFCFGHSSSCSSAGGYYEVPIRSVFSRGLDNWTAKDGTGKDVELEWVVPQQQIAAYSTPNVQGIYYLAPRNYLGDQRKSYNRHLNFTLYIDDAENLIVPTKRNDKLVIIEGYGGALKISMPNRATELNPIPINYPQHYSFILHPNAGWRPQLTEWEFLTLLSSITAIKIKASFTPEGSSYLDNVFLETAQTTPDGPPVASVETCVCPAGHTGASCEKCAKGFMRANCEGDSFTKCIPCDCSRKCIDVDETTGDNCMCGSASSPEHPLRKGK